MGNLTGDAAGSTAGDAVVNAIGGPAGNELEGRIRSLVVDQLGVAAADVTPHAHILDDLGADSLDVVELMMALEDAFDIEVPDEAVEGMQTIADIAAYVRQRAGS